jgi:hypothetical protein
MEYKYHLTLRPFSIGTQPDEGFLRFEDDGTRYGVLVYSRKLSLKEAKHFSLTAITEAEELNGKTVMIYDYEWKLELKKNIRGCYYFDAILYDEGEEVDRMSLMTWEVMEYLETIKL